MKTTQYLLVCLMEEAAEIQQAAAKCLRFGLDNYHPEKPEETNSAALDRELADLDAVRYMLVGKGVLPYPILLNQEPLRNKISKVTRFMEVSKMCGTLEQEAADED